VRVAFLHLGADEENEHFIRKGTGDNARYIVMIIAGAQFINCGRHDEDHKIPRTPSEVFDLNRQVATRMEKIFLKKGIPVVPSIGRGIRIFCPTAPAYDADRK